MLLSHFAGEEPEVTEDVRPSQSHAAYSWGSNADFPGVTALYPTQVLRVGEEEGLIRGIHVNHSWTNRNFREQTTSALATSLGPATPRPSWAHSLPIQPANHSLPCLPPAFSPALSGL